MERVLRLDQAQEEGVRKKDSAKRKWAQKREAVPIPIELKAWRSDLRFLANTFIRAFPESWWVAHEYPYSHSCLSVSPPGGRLRGITSLLRPMVSPRWSLHAHYPGLLCFLLLEIQCLILDSFF